MAFQHQIDGTNVDFINFANWVQPVIDQSLDIIAVHQKMRFHIWQASVVTAAEWTTLLSKRGQIVSLTTTDVDDRNADYITYFGARVQAATFRNHEGRNILGVELRFLVKV